MRGFAFTTLLLLSAVLAGCVGEDASEIIDDTTPEINSEDDRPEDTTQVEKEDCEERGGTWTEAPDREGESYCDFDDEDDRGEDDSEITQEDCEERGGTWDEQTRDCSFPEERPEEEEQEPEPTYIPSCNVTASQGMNSTANPENWPELQSGKWNDIEGLTQISYATPVDDTEAIVDTRLDWMCGYTYSVRPPSDYNDSKQYPIFIFLHGGVTNDWFFTNFLTNNCLLYTSPSPRDTERSRMPSSA